MAAISITKLFVPVFLPNAAGVLFTMPTTPATSLLKGGRVRLANPTASAATARLYADVAATGNGDVNTFLPTTSIPAGGYIDVDLPAMAAGDTLRGVAGTANAIAMSFMDGTIFS